MGERKNDFVFLRTLGPMIVRKKKFSVRTFVNYKEAKNSLNDYEWKVVFSVERSDQPPKRVAPTQKRSSHVQYVVEQTRVSILILIRRVILLSASRYFS